MPQYSKKIKVYESEPIPSDSKELLNDLINSGDLFRYTSEKSIVNQLEKKFATLMGMKYALAVSSCSAGLHISLESIGLAKGSNVLIPGFTFAAVPSAIINAGMNPILVEINDNFRIDIQDFSEKIKKNIQAVMISHMRGHTSDMDQIISICKDIDVPIIEDAAHSLGTLWGNKKIGTIGNVGCFSFQSYKMINGGEGGMLVTNDSKIMAKAIILSGAYEHNWQKHNLDDKLILELEKNQNKLPLYNLRMSNLSAAVIIPQLRELDKRVSTGLNNHNYVAKKLNQSKFINVPDALPKEIRAPDSIQFNLLGFDEDQMVINFIENCKQLGVNVQSFGLSKNNARAFWNWEFIPGPVQNLPRTKKILMRACDVRLPVSLTKADLDFICSSIIEAVNNVRSNYNIRN